jgi:adenylate kinase family enzyme
VQPAALFEDNCDTRRNMSAQSQWHRISVVGNSGSGKSRLAAELAAALGTRHVELDAVIHQKDWVDLAPEEFSRRVAELVAEASWVIDGNYSQVRDLVWGRANTVVWLDPPRRTVMRRVVGRTLNRVITGRELWNGNRETWRDVLSRDPQRSIIAWAWVEHRRYQATYRDASSDPAWAHLRFLRMADAQDRRRLLSDCRGWAKSPKRG